MISFIRGTVADLTENSAIIESNCIGFEVDMTVKRSGTAAHWTGSEASVLIFR